MSDRSITPHSFIAPLSTTTGKVQWCGIIGLSLMVLLAALAPLLTPFGPREVSCAAFEKPSLIHLFGCDDAGYDILSQVLYGARVSLTIGLLVAVVATCIAAVFAVVVGVYGGWVDRLIMRFVDVVMALPFMPLVIVLGVYFGASLQTQILVIAVLMWASPVRELRAQVLTIRSSAYIEASRAMGANVWFIGTRHLLPELAPLIVPQFIRIAHAAILVETSLSFLGLGDPTQTSWGSLLFHANARTAFLTGAWVNWIVPPGLAVSLTVLSLALIGFGYDGSVGPRVRARKPAKIIQPENAKPAADAVLTARGLRVSYESELGSSEAVRGVDITLCRGELLGLVGESGSGKTTVSLAILRLLRFPAVITHGAVYLGDTDLMAMPHDRLTALRGRRLALIPQSAMNALNPVMTIGHQLEDAISHGGETNIKARRAKACEWLERVDLATKHHQSYAHELSGGMRQRAVIAIALCNNPDVVIADEPTTGLDVLVQEGIMSLLLELRQKLNLTVLFVTHNLPLIARHADRIAVMYRGEIVDEGAPTEVQSNPQHPHTRALFDNLPTLHGPKRWPPAITTSSAQPLIELCNVSKIFHPLSIVGLRRGTSHSALRNVSLSLAPGEKLGLVGGSGAGKSTIARMLTGMSEPSHGTVHYAGKELIGNRYNLRRIMCQSVHMVFQDPYQSLRTGMSIRDVIAEPLRIHGERSTTIIDNKVRAALTAVHLPCDSAFMSRRPVQLSGGQRQRVAFARAIVTQPRVIIADEPTSMLDQSVRMEIMDLMEDLRQRFGTAFLFITHDIALARHFCDRLIVLKDGQIVEEGEADSVIHTPREAYTQRLIKAV